MEHKETEGKLKDAEGGRRELLGTWRTSTSKRETPFGNGREGPTVDLLW